MSKEIVVGACIVEALEKLGVEYFIGTPGTEFAPIIEKFVKDKNLKIKAITVPHEYLAINMAYGIYLATQKPAVVMVHSTIGTLNAAAGIMNASRMNIPIIFLAGRSSNNDFYEAPRDLFIHWAQESFDQAGCIREYLKWDYELKEVRETTELIERGYSISMDCPRGPVYLVLARDLLLKKIKIENLKYSEFTNNYSIPSLSTIDKFIELIKESHRPIILTKTIGETNSGLMALEKFLSFFEIPVFTPNSSYFNLKNSHSCYKGEDVGINIENADLIINLGMDVPWIPSKTKLENVKNIIQIAHDPLFSRIPKHHFPGTLNVKCDPQIFLEECNKRLISVTKLKFEDWHSQIDNNKCNSSAFNQVGLNKDDIISSINEVWNEDCILINELSLNSSNLKLSTFGSYFRTGSASGLGWAMGAALGISLAQPHKIIFNVVGDGAYYFGNPLAYHWIIEKYQLKVITIILNNSGMHSITKNISKFFSEKGFTENKQLPFIDLSPSLKFEEVARCFDGNGFKVNSKKELDQALINSLENLSKIASQNLINVILN